MTSQGFITLDRKLQEWQWYDDSMMVHLWIHLLLSANHEDKKWHGIEIKRGQLVTSLTSISESTGMSVQNIRTRLARLEEGGCIVSKSTNKFRIITITKYDSYQSQEVVRQQATNKQLTGNQQTTNKQLTTNNNDNNINNYYYNACACEMKPYDKVTKDNVPQLTDTWIEEIQMMVYRQVRVKVSSETMQEYYKDYCAQEVTEMSDSTYKEFRQHFGNYVRKQEQIKKENGNDKQRQAGNDRLREAQITATSAKDYASAF